MNRALAALAGVLLTLVGASAVLAFQRATGGGQASAAAETPRGSGAVIVDWNKELVKIVNTPGAQPATVHPTRSFAILSAAMYDAVVSITRGSSPYLFSLDAPSGARADAAAAAAAHDSLVALYPPAKSALDRQLASELAAIPDGTAKSEGIEVGRLSAALTLAARADDGSSLAPPVFPAATQPGDWRPAPPALTPGVFTQWSAVTPFVLDKPAQFRPAAPPALSSAAYAQSLNEVKSLGQNTSSARTPDQTVTAKFWPGPIWTTWNEIAEKSVLSHHTDLAHTARLFALLNLSLADTAIAFYDAKYQYHLWRPITAIREADNDGNPVTAGDRNWTPLLATAPDPSYPGAHSAISGAAATVLATLYGDHDKIDVTSDVLPNVTRSFNSFSAAASEAGLSRIYGGVHTRTDHEAGLKLGHQVAGFVLHEAGASGFGLKSN